MHGCVELCMKGKEKWGLPLQAVLCLSSFKCLWLYPSLICRKHEAVKAFPPQARLARIFPSSAGQDSASACCSVRAALPWAGRDTVQGRGAECPLGWACISLSWVPRSCSARQECESDLCHGLFPVIAASKMLN